MNILPDKLSDNLKVKGLIWKITWLALSIATLVYFKGIERSKAERVEYRPIYWDAISYYAYLPATFIYHDLSLDFTRRPGKDMNRQFWPETAPNGGLVIKTTMGIAWLYAPFFFAAHVYSLFSGDALSGFSQPYQFAIGISGLFYGLWGLWLMGGVLRRYFPDAAVAATLVCFAVGTNLFNYITYEAAMSHAFNFFLIAWLLKINQRWHDEPTAARSFWLGFLVGWITLVRPTNILIILVPVLFGMGSPVFREKYRILAKNPRWVLYAIMGAFLIGFPQLIYWKLNSGHWLFFSYTGEKFYWTRPYIVEFLFSYRKGWLVYSPLLLLSFAGLFSLRGSARGYLTPILLLFPIIIYLLSCWWTWWFGGGFGGRPMVDWYPLLMIPFAAILHALWKGNWLVKIPAVLVILFCLTLSWHQNWQYKVGLIHYDSMSKKAYQASFFKSHYPDGYDDMIITPQYSKLHKGGREEVETIFD